MAVQKLAPFLHDGRPSRVNFTCDACKSVCYSIADFSIHVQGKKHKQNVKGTIPWLLLKDMDRLQYFLDNHMKEYPLLGLEYIMEERLDPTSYNYTCQLCDMQGNQSFMLYHITFVEHVERYIEKDHKDFSLKVYSYPSRVRYIKALVEISFIIIEKYGRPKIKVSDVKEQNPSKKTVESPKGDRRESGVWAASRHVIRQGSMTQGYFPPAKKTKTQHI